MPELPEVETVRRGIERAAVGRRVDGLEIFGPRTLRRHPAGVADFPGRVVGSRLLAADRRGKYLWLPLDRGGAVVAHLGMSGQFLAAGAGEPDPPHLRARFRFADDGPELRFVDQRTFGGLAWDELVPVGGREVPAAVAHIAADPLEPGYDAEAVVRLLRGRRTGIKRALLDQTVVSGVGNIYADEALWRARLHYAAATDRLIAVRLRELLGAVADVLREALRAGGTSFDALYVGVEGDPGWFERSLDVYGREGEPCARCGAAIRREPFMNRSSYRCPRCQRQPRHARW